MHESQRYAAYVVEKTLSGSNLDLAFDHVFKISNDLEQQPQIKALAYGALRHLGKTKFIINKLVKNKIENRLIESLLHVALFQLSQKTHSDFTIVNQSVKAAKKIDIRKSKFVNAVLRNFLRNKENLLKDSDGVEEVKFNYPGWWINKLRKDYKDNWIDILNIGNQHPPLTIRINNRKISNHDYKILLNNANIFYKVIHGEALILSNALNIQSIPGFNDGFFSVQDFGAQLATSLLDIHDDQLVLDACAAPGGKTTSILENHNVHLVSLEKNESRAKKVMDNLKRLDLTAKLKIEALDKENNWWDKIKFDRVLLDVPCSASGIVRRHIDIKWLRRPNDLQKFSHNQLEMINNAWPLLKSKGKLLYVTCSIFKEENEDVIARFCNERDDVIRGELKFPKIVRRLKNQLIPSENHDGLFYEILEKK